MTSTSTRPQRTRDGPRASLKVRTLGDLLSENIPPRQMLLGPWLHQRHLSMIYAPTGVGKSLFAVSLALAVAGGGRFLGWKAALPRSVMYVDGEMDVEDLQDRAKVLSGVIPEINLGSARENLIFLAQQDQTPAAGFPDLADETQHPRLLDEVARVGAELVILDNFSTLATVEDENAAHSFNPVLNLLRRLKQMGVACILIHHARKGRASEDSYRGNSKMAVVFNSIISLRRPKGTPAHLGATFNVAWDKCRGLRDESTRSLTVSLNTQGPHPPRWDFELSTDERLMGIVDMLRSGEYGTQKALAAAVGVSTGQLSKLRAKAIGTELITSKQWDECLAAAREGGDEMTVQDF